MLILSGPITRLIGSRSLATTINYMRQTDLAPNSGLFKFFLILFRDKELENAKMRCGIKYATVLCSRRCSRNPQFHERSRQSSLREIYDFRNITLPKGSGSRWGEEIEIIFFSLVPWTGVQTILSNKYFNENLFNFSKLDMEV